MADSDSSMKRGQCGFTLVELMVSVAIVGILVAIAATLYSQQVQKSRRTDARTAVLDLAGREERFYSVANNYSALPTDIGYSGAFPQPIGNGYYTITVTVPDPAFAGVGPSYVITATAIGTQVNDTSCASFSINQIGKQSSLDSGGVDSTATCWS